MWHEISAVVAAHSADSVGDALSERGALAVTLADAADQPIFEPAPGDTPLWQATCVTGLFNAEADFESLAQSLSAGLGLENGHWRHRVIQDRAWERTWMERFKPIKCGTRLWVVPSHHEVPDEADVVLRLDPGLAFGTGSHPTTALCLKAIDSLVQPGWRVLDYGCGSGVLAIAALKFGAESALAIDIDAQALLASEDNARRNEVAKGLETSIPKDVANLDFDLVLANILAGPLVQLAPMLTAAARPGAKLVLSGILESQIDMVDAAYKDGFVMSEPMLQDGWACLVGARR